MIPFFCYLRDQFNIFVVARKAFVSLRCFLIYRIHNIHKCSFLSYFTKIPSQHNPTQPNPSHPIPTQPNLSHPIPSHPIVSYRIVSYRIVSYCIVLYCIVLHCIVFYLLTTSLSDFNNIILFTFFIWYFITWTPFLFWWTSFLTFLDYFLAHD